MKTLRLPIEVVRDAVSISAVDDKDRQWLIQQIAMTIEGEKNISLPIAGWPVTVLRAVLDEGRLNQSQRAMISLQLFGLRENATATDGNPNDIWDAMVTSPSQAMSELMRLGETNNCEIKISGRWYLANMKYTLVGREKNLAIEIPVRFGTMVFKYQASIIKDDFRRDGISKNPRKIRDLLRSYGLRQVQSDIKEHNLLIMNAENLSNEVGKQVSVSGPVVALVKMQYHTAFEPASLGTKDWPRSCVIEPFLEVPENMYCRYADATDEAKLPFVRLFSFDQKRYVFADIRDISDYEYDAWAINRLALPDNLMNTLKKVFDAPQNLLLDDIVKGKHGGLVILACGGSGVGKTLTAEVFAEHTGRPLYKLGLAELGTKVEKVEASIQVVFERVARWNAVLLFDEIDVFLLKRGEDLERSAIVGVFLRLMDYYRGVMFMTTNRPDVLDDAIRTRITLRIDYPDLDDASRLKVWEDLFKQADIKYSGHMNVLARKPFNGRVIRNLVRLAKIMNPSGLISNQDMEAVCSHAVEHPK